MTYSEISGRMSDALGEVSSLIDKALSSGIPLLDEADRSILSRPGKMVRPLMALLAARCCCGLCSEDAIRVAAASELMHNATLLHDDVVDGGTVRRGAPTVMSLLSGKASVLLGDYWLVKAIGLILDLSRYSERVVRIFSATLQELAEGELLQMQMASSGNMDEKAYYRIIHCKTASLFHAAVSSAAIVSGASEEVTDALGKYALYLGYAFQIKDDLLDFASRQQTGKPMGQDIAEGKVTLPLLGAFRKVSPEEQTRVRTMLSGAYKDTQLKDSVIDFVHANGGDIYAEEHIHANITRAVEAISILPESEDRQALADIAAFMEGRKR